VAKVRGVVRRKERGRIKMPCENGEGRKTRRKKKSEGE